MQQSGRLISSLGSGFDTVEALSIVQRWASNAGSTGFPEISHYARELENLLQQNGRGSMVRTRELLVRLAVGGGGVFQVGGQFLRLVELFRSIVKLTGVGERSAEGRPCFRNIWMRRTNLAR